MQRTRRKGKSVRLASGTTPWHVPSDSAAAQAPPSPRTKNRAPERLRGDAWCKPTDIGTRVILHAVPRALVPAICGTRPSHALNASSLTLPHVVLRCLTTCAIVMSLLGVSACGGSSGAAASSTATGGRTRASPLGKFDRCIAQNSMLSTRRTAVEDDVTDARFGAGAKATIGQVVPDGHKASSDARAIERAQRAHPKGPYGTNGVIAAGQFLVEIQTRAGRMRQPIIGCAARTLTK
jgi:hypothetical protein